MAAALACSAIALLLRAVYLIEARDNPFWIHLGLDMEGYDRWARSILAGNGLGEAPFTQAPLFPLLLSLVYALTGSQPVAALWVHLLPATATVFLIALAAGLWRGSRAAWTAGLLAALYKPAIFYTGVLLPPTWVTLAAALCLYIIMKAGCAGRPARPRLILGAGLLLGLLAVGQPVLLALALPAGWYLAGGNRARWAWLAAGVAVPLFATMIHNGTHGAWSPVAVNGGVNLYIGNGPEANGAYVRPAGMREDRDLLGVAASGAGDPASANAFWFREALRTMAADVPRVLGLLLRKIQLFFSQYEVPQVESLPFESRYALLLRLPLPGMALLTALGAFGLLRRRDDRTARWLGASVAAGALGVALFFVTARFRLFAMPLLAVLAGGGVASLRRGEGRRSWLLPGAVAGTLWLLLSLGPGGLDRQASLGQYQFRLGAIAETEKRMEAAVAHYQEALRLDPSLGKAEVNLGTLKARQGLLDEARDHLERGTRLDPQSAVGFTNLGQIHQLQGRAQEALAAYQRAIVLDGRLLSARESAALLLYELGEDLLARATLDTLRGLAPPGSPPRARAERVLRLLEQRTGERLHAWRASAALRRADLMLAQGDVARARALYGEAMRQGGDAVVALEAERMLREISVPGR